MSRLEYDYYAGDVWNNEYDEFDNYCTRWVPVSELKEGMEIAVPELSLVDPVVVIKIFENDSVSFQSESKNKTTYLDSFEMAYVSEVFEPFINNSLISFNYFSDYLPYSNSEVLVSFSEFIENCLQFRGDLEGKAHFNPINLSNSSKVILVCGPLSSLFNFSIYSSLTSSSSIGSQLVISQNSSSSLDNLPVLIKLSNISFFMDSSLPNSDQFTQEKCFISDLNSSGMDIVNDTIYISPRLTISSNLRNCFNLIANLPFKYSGQLISGCLSNLSFNSFGIDIVNVAILLPPSSLVNTLDFVSLFKSFAENEENKQLDSTIISPAPEFYEYLLARFPLYSSTSLDKLFLESLLPFNISSTTLNKSNVLSLFSTDILSSPHYNDENDYLKVVGIFAENCEFGNYCIKVSQLEESMEIAVPKKNEIYGSVENLYPSDFNWSNNSLVLNTLTSNCCLKCGSLDQTGILLNAKERARYSVSSLSRISELAGLRNFSNLDLETNSILLLNLVNSSLNSADESFDNFSILNWCFSNSLNKYSGEYNFTLSEKIISLVTPVPINAVNNIVASITNFIYSSSEYNSLYLLCRDLFTSLANLSASSSVNLDLAVIFLNISKDSASFSCSDISSLANSDQLIHLKESILAFNSSFNETLTLTIYITPSFTNCWNFSNCSTFFLKPAAITSFQLTSGLLSILSFNSLGKDNVIFFIISPLVYERQVVDTQKEDVLFKSFDENLTKTKRINRTKKLQMEQITP